MMSAIAYLLLLASGALLSQEAETPKERFERLSSDYHREVEAFMEDYRNLSTEEERQRLLADPTREPRKLFLPRFEQAARDCAGTPGEIPFLLWLAKDGAAVEVEIAKRSIQALLERHVDRPEMADLAAAIRRGAGLFGESFARRMLDRLIKQVEDPSTEAQALYQRARLLARLDRRTQEVERQTRIDLRRARDLSDDPELLEEIAALERELDQLAIGQPAPSFVAEDLTGRAWKLEDLRGEVVVLDFWATWCGPCIAMIPQQRELVKALAGEPFQLIGVSNDEEREAVETFLERERLPWPQIHDGKDGSLAKQWNVRSWPKIFVIDADGILRGKDLEDEELEQLVRELLREAKEG